jgi:hypothetical protein
LLKFLTHFFFRLEGILMHEKNVLLRVIDFLKFLLQFTNLFEKLS